MITGKDIIMFILKYDLVNERIFTDEFIEEMFVPATRVAEHFLVGVATIQAMHELGTIRGFVINGELYFPKAILNTKGDAGVEK